MGLPVAAPKKVAPKCPLFRDSPVAVMTQYNIPLYKGHDLWPECTCVLPTIHFSPPIEDNLSTKSKSAEF